MGTRRSRHNKGRKPFYKEIDRETARHQFFFEEDARFAKRLNGLRCTYCKRVLESFESESRVAATKDHWIEKSAGGKEVVPCCIQCNKLKADMLPAQWQAFMEANPGWWRRPALERRAKHKPSDKAAELLPTVAAYLEKRRTVDARKAANEIFPTLPVTLARVISHDEITFATGTLHASEHDVLMQLFIERKISVGKLHAGRRWQLMREIATLQPSASIDWSRSIGSSGRYQRRGDLSDSQDSAMQYRREFVQFVGLATATFADFCLEPDRGLDDLVRILKIDAHQVWRIVSDLLEKMCAFRAAIQASAA